jgi:hypothetical protein
MKHNRYSIHIRETERAKLRALRDDFVRLASDAAYKKAVIAEARARDAEWDTIKASTRPVKQRRLF